MFYADFHVHSRFSRAVSRDCTLPELALWGRKKGLSVVGTGDFTHPKWFSEINDQLVPAEPGLFRLNDAEQKELDKEIEDSCRGVLRFVISTEISTIYKKNGRTRKVHHLVFMPHLEGAAKFIERLSKIGNLASDGRPILGMDSRDLLEIVLESADGAFLIPAHIWTPWFSALGASSGFDSIEECYGDLAGHVFALETGLSSDPAMNWRLSALDRFRLVSNSDAHSPSKLGREACIFDTEMDFHKIRAALESGRGFGGTLEFFPDEGKYHLDGHRLCEVRLLPDETSAKHGLCPVCGKPVTIGVMNRVSKLADRPDGARPENAAPFYSLIPLQEILSEILSVGPASLRVRKAFSSLIAKIGPELYILKDAPAEELAKCDPPLLAEAIVKMRRGEVTRDPGYDGCFGVIKLFAKQ